MPQAAIELFRDQRKRVPVQSWLEELKIRDRRAYAACLFAILELERLGFEARRPLADSLRDGIRELRARSGKVQYRLLYFFSGANIVVLSHGFTKEREVPNVEIERAIANARLVESDHARYTAEWEVER